MKVALHTWTPETGLLPEVEPWAEPGEDLLLVWGPEVLLRAFLRFGRGAGDLRQSLILGCSGSGSILGPTVSDEHLVVARLRFLQTRLKVAGLPAGGPGRSRRPVWIWRVVCGTMGSGTFWSFLMGSRSMEVSSLKGSRRGWYLA